MIPVLALLKGFSPKTWGLIALGLASIVLATKILLWVEAKQDAAVLREATIVELNKALAGERQERRDAEIERDTVNATLSRQIAAQEDSRRLLETLNTEMSATRVEVNEMQDIFDRHNFKKLTNAKPGLIITRVNRGTQDVFDKVEAAINDN